MFRPSLAALLITGVATSAGAAAPASGAAIASGLVAHRAIYDLELKDATERSGIAGMYGRMVYEFNGSACEGYTTNFRFVTRIDMEEQPQRVTDQLSTTFEGADGKNFRFVNKTFVDKELVKEVRGDAKLEGGKTVVELSKPKENKLDLKGTQFPTGHMEELIGKAHRDCFIANSVATSVEIMPTFEFHEAPAHA